MTQGLENRGGGLLSETPFRLSMTVLQQPDMARQRESPLPDPFAAGGIEVRRGMWIGTPTDLRRLRQRPAAGEAGARKSREAEEARPRRGLRGPVFDRLVSETPDAACRKRGAPDDVSAIRGLQFAVGSATDAL